MALVTLYIILACSTPPLLHSVTATTTTTAASSGPAGRVCELYDIAHVIFGFTYYTATSTKDHIHSWLTLNGNTTKPGMREGMLYCEVYYIQAIGAFRKGAKYTVMRDSKGQFELAMYVKERGLACETAFMHGYPDSVMARKNKNFIQLADTRAAVSGLLAPI